MFPIADSKSELQYTPYFTWILIVSNILVFFYQSWLNEEQLNSFIMHYGAIPSVISAGENLQSLFTSMFIHGWLMHIVGNMLFLHVFGDNIEGRIGHFKFLLFYIAWWLSAHALQILMTWSGSDIPSIGASGCIAAVLWAYLIMFPNNQIRMFDIRTMSSYPVGSSQFLLYRIAIQFVSGTGSLMSTSEWWVWYRAHIGWFAFGRLGSRFMKSNNENGLT